MNIKYFILSILFIFTPRTLIAEDIAVVVNLNNPISELSKKELSQIYYQKVSRWKTSEKILCVNQVVSANARRDFFRAVFDLPPDPTKDEKVSNLPTDGLTVSTDDSVKKFIASMPNAVGYISAKNIDSTIKVLKIDGYLPNESGYPIR